MSLQGRVALVTGGGRGVGRGGREQQQAGDGTEEPRGRGAAAFSISP